MRVNNWQSQLHAYLQEHAHARFKYGCIDCGIFVADAVQVLTGVDPAADLRGKYANRREAFAAIKALCGKPTMEAVAGYLAEKSGMREIPVAFARRADAVLIGAGAKSHLGIVAMHGTHIVAPGKSGLVYLSKDRATRAWRIE